ncbi:MAG: amidohydrolase, partial [Halioglobus sp.]|nr:amidohydrolase [Halioglobus sp.]
MDVADSENITAFRRELHSRPELSECEVQTSKAIAGRLALANPDLIADGLGTMNTGICAVFDSGVPGPTVLLRAELDALPIEESNTFEHRSVVQGVSHKCGHDGHMATLLAVAEGLRAKPVEFGRVYLLFQPAEETGTGAAAVIADERFQALAPPDFVYAFHNVPKYPLGRVLIRDGLFAQASVGFIVQFHGTTSHSSYPEYGTNPSLAVTELIAAVSSFDTGLADRVAAPILGTISYAQLGVAEMGPNFGTTPGEACVMGVVRAHRSDDLARVRVHLVELTERLAAASGLSHELSWHEAFAATASSAECVSVVERAALEVALTV